MNYSITRLDPFFSENIYSGSMENAENTISSVICHLCSLERDQEFFQHSLPASICDAVCGSVTGEVSANAPGVRSFTYRLVGRGSSDNSSIFSKLRALFLHAGEPLFMTSAYHGDVDTAVVQCFFPLDGWQKQMLSFGGVKVPRIIWHLRFDVLSAG